MQAARVILGLLLISATASVLGFSATKATYELIEFEAFQIDGQKLWGECERGQESGPYFENFHIALVTVEFESELYLNQTAFSDLDLTGVNIFDYDTRRSDNELRDKKILPLTTARRNGDSNERTLRSLLTDRLRNSLDDAVEKAKKKEEEAKNKLNNEVAAKTSTLRSHLNGIDSLGAKRGPSKRLPQFILPEGLIPILTDDSLAYLDCGNEIYSGTALEFIETEYFAFFMLPSTNDSFLSLLTEGEDIVDQEDAASVLHTNSLTFLVGLKIESTIGESVIVGNLDSCTIKFGDLVVNAEGDVPEDVSGFVLENPTCSFPAIDETMRELETLVDSISEADPFDPEPTFNAVSMKLYTLLYTKSVRACLLRAESFAAEVDRNVLIPDSRDCPLIKEILDEECVAEFEDGFYDIKGVYSTCSVMNPAWESDPCCNRCTDFDVCCEDKDVFVPTVDLIPTSGAATQCSNPSKVAAWMATFNADLINLGDYCSISIAADDWLDHVFFCLDNGESEEDTASCILSNIPPTVLSLLTEFLDLTEVQVQQLLEEELVSYECSGPSAHRLYYPTKEECLAQEACNWLDTDDEYLCFRDNTHLCWTGETDDDDFLVSTSTTAECHTLNLVADAAECASFGGHYDESSSACLIPGPATCFDHSLCVGVDDCPEFCYRPSVDMEEDCTEIVDAYSGEWDDNLDVCKTNHTSKSDCIGDGFTFFPGRFLTQVTQYHTQVLCEDEDNFNCDNGLNANLPKYLCEDGDADISFCIEYCGSECVGHPSSECEEDASTKADCDLIQDATWWPALSKCTTPGDCSTELDFWCEQLSTNQCAEMWEKCENQPRTCESEIECITQSGWCDRASSDDDPKCIVFRPSLGLEDPFACQSLGLDWGFDGCANHTANTPQLCAEIGGTWDIYPLTSETCVSDIPFICYRDDLEVYHYSEECPPCADWIRRPYEWHPATNNSWVPRNISKVPWTWTPRAMENKNTWTLNLHYSFLWDIDSLLFDLELLLFEEQHLQCTIRPVAEVFKVLSCDCGDIKGSDCFNFPPVKMMHLFLFSSQFPFYQYSFDGTMFITVFPNAIPANFTGAYLSTFSRTAGLLGMVHNNSTHQVLIEMKLLAGTSVGSVVGNSALLEINFPIQASMEICLRQKSDYVNPNNHTIPDFATYSDGVFTLLGLDCRVDNDIYDSFNFICCNVTQDLLVTTSSKRSGTQGAEFYPALRAENYQEPTEPTDVTESSSSSGSLVALVIIIVFVVVFVVIIVAVIFIFLKKRSSKTQVFPHN